MPLPPDIYEDFAEEARDVLSGWERGLLDLQSNFSAEVCKELARAAHNLKGTALACGLEQFSSYIHKIEDVIVGIGSGEVKINSTLIGELLHTQDIMHAWLEETIKDPEHFPEKIVAQSLSDIEKATKEDNNGEASSGGSNAGANDSPKSAATNTQQKSVRVPTEKLDRLVQLLGELSVQNSILTHSILTDDFDKGVQESTAIISSKLIKEIQNISISLRMIQIKSLFQRLERTALDVARKLNKKINVKTLGAHHELDKTVIEQISDSLVHVIRNAVDHGIESPEDRKKSQKPEIGSVQFEAKKSVDGILVTITDDGGGLNPERIKQKAIEKNLISASDELTLHEIQQLIFEPGFSSSDSVSDISGRGVGMDVLRSTIDKLGGHIEIQSEYGKGTTFVIHIPATLNMLDAVIISEANTLYAVPLQDIEEIVTLDDFEINKIGQSETILYRNQPTPLIRLKNALLSDYSDLESLEQQKVIFIIQRENSKVGLIIDQVIRHQSVVIKPNVGTFQNTPIFGAATIFGDGNPGMILNVHAIAESYKANLERVS